MTGPFEVWRQRLWLWVLPVAFCLLNLLVLGFYQGSLAGGVEGLEARYERSQETLGSLAEERRRVETFLDYERRNREGIESLYQKRSCSVAKRSW